MKEIIRIAVCVFFLASLFGCVASTETDPRKGGLFGYNPTAYEKRLEERKAKLADTEADTEKAKHEGQQLEASRQTKQAEHEAMKNKLASLYAETGKLEKQLKKAKTANAAQESELIRLQEEVSALRSSTIKVNNSSASDEAKKAEIERLQKRMDELLEEAEALSSL